MENNQDSLSIVVERMLSDPSVKETINALKIKLQRSREPFVWRTVNIKSVLDSLPKNLRSAWIFILRRGTPSAAHYHPNSVQYTAMIEGKGRAIIDGVNKELKLFNTTMDTKQWIVIDENIPHKFFPGEEDMVVISFHTCLDNELREIEVGSKRQRLYLKE
jgi:oxalate decarboxylase/phosphoglucose isomerase-like protein (cupin superfamily)